MSFRVSVALAAALLAPAQWTNAQTLPVAASVAATQPIDTPAASLADARFPPPPGPGAGVTFGAPTPRNPFTSIGHDLKKFFSRDTAMVIGMLAPVAGVALTWDNAGIEESQEHLDKSSFQPGNIGGSFLVQTGASVATWAVGKMSGNRKTAEVGGDLMRAQFVSQVVVQGVKFATRRERPDDSNNHSFPSGHTSSAFATASVLERHFGWKAGLPGLRIRHLRRTGANVGEQAPLERHHHGCGGGHRGRPDGDDGSRRREVRSRRRADAGRRGRHVHEALAIRGNVAPAHAPLGPCPPSPDYSAIPFQFATR